MHISNMLVFCLKWLALWTHKYNCTAIGLVLYASYVQLVCVYIPGSI